MAAISAQQLASRIHGQGMRFVIAVTGGGSAAISSLLGVPGASRSILAATAPYCPEATIEWLGAKPDEFCCSWTGRAMAMAAFQKAKKYDPEGNVCGVACTASLVSDRPKRGAHRAFMAYQTASTTCEWSIEFEKGARSRAEEEALVAALLQNLMAEACAVSDRIELTLRRGERVETRQITASQDLRQLLAGQVLSLPRGAAQKDVTPGALLPGAFHPLHEAHREMARVAGEMLHADVAFELSIVNVEKPTPDFLEIDERLKQFDVEDAVWLTRAPTFVDKAGLFPGVTFVVGADTIARVGEARYYREDTQARDAALERIAALGCRFLVFARAYGGAIHTLADLSLPPSLERLCRQVPADVFRNDISSTQLREAHG